MNKLFYFSKGYDTLKRWCSYWYQIQSIIKAQPQSVLLVGIGNGVVPDYLRSLGIKVICMDIREDLKPDVKGDVRKIAELVESKSVDVVCAFQVLEHLPYTDFVPTLKQMASVARLWVIISLPQQGKPTALSILWNKKRWIWARVSKIRFNQKHKSHRWEIDAKGHSLTTITQALQSVFLNCNYYTCPDNPYHGFFECKVRP
jgi:hypothetical protein